MFVTLWRVRSASGRRHGRLVRCSTEAEPSASDHMSVQMPGPLPRSLVVAALSKPRPDTGRTRGWMRRRGLPPVSAPDLAAGGEVCIDSRADFVQCYHPG